MMSYYGSYYGYEGDTDYFIISEIHTRTNMFINELAKFCAGCDYTDELISIYCKTYSSIVFNLAQILFNRYSDMSAEEIEIMIKLES